MTTINLQPIVALLDLMKFDEPLRQAIKSVNKLGKTLRRLAKAGRYTYRRSKGHRKHIRRMKQAGLWEPAKKPEHKPFWMSNCI